MTSSINQEIETNISPEFYANLLKSGKRAEVISHLKADIRRHRMGLYAMNKEGARKLVSVHSDYIDQIIILFYNLARSLSGVEGGNGINLSLVAVGGYGRKELCPYSDIDLLFLYENKIDNYVENTVNEILYLLWDLGFQLGHSCRSAKESLRLARHDLTVCTSLIESRYMAGSKAGFDRFFNALLMQVRKQGDAFVREKIKEQSERHARYDYSVNLLEPNIKESPGGLRDYHLCLWAATVLYGRCPSDGFFGIKILSDDELKTFLCSVDLLLKVRNQLHLTCSRHCDTLAIDYQDTIAKGMGYKNQRNKSASQQLMQDYYIHANHVRYISRIFLQQCLKSDSEKKRAAKKLKKVNIEQGFSAFEGELILSKEQKNPFKENPLLMIVVFEWCGRYNLVLSSDVKRLVQKSLSLINNDFRVSGKVKDVFLSVLKFKNSSQVLRHMHEVHFLGHYIPEFDPLTCLAQRDLYHQFTVDEHTLMTITHLEELAFNRNPSELAGLYDEMKNPELLKLALLFHDLGKGGKTGHIAGSIGETKRILARMGFDSAVQDVILFLVENHLKMNYLAQHHDLDDIHTIRSFADVFRSPEYLKMLYLVSYADIRSVGHDVWNDWKGLLLSDLYHRTIRFLEKKIPGDLKQKVLLSLPPEINIKDAEIYFDSLPDRHQDFFSVDKTVKHLKLIAEKKSKPVQISYDQDANFTELMVCTDNRFGVLAQITGVLASQGINILGAQVNTLKNGIAIDTLQITDIDYKPIADSKILKKIELILASVLQGKQSIDSLQPSRKRFFILKKEAALPVTTKINLDNGFSPHYTVIQLVCRDRLGLLYDITGSLSEMGIDIRMAKITTEAHRAIDTFYATEKDGKKITVEWRKNTIKKKLKNITNPIEPE